MSLYWITECNYYVKDIALKKIFLQIKKGIPYAITSILPVLLFPMFGIMSSKQVASIYFSVKNSIIINITNYE